MFGVMAEVSKKIAKEYVSNETFSAAIVDAVNYNRWVVDFYKDHICGNVLEIGVGHGSFIDFMPSGVSSYTGLDIDPQLIEAAQKRNPQARYYIGDLASVNFAHILENRTFDTIICINVLEHIENHQVALSNLLNCLNPNGKLLLFVPAFQALYQDMDRLAGHCRRYSINDVQKLVRSCNGVLLKWSYFNPVGGLGWWLNKFKKHQDLNDSGINAQIRFFDTYILPISKLLQPFFRRLFGQSVYCLIQRGNT